MKQSTIILSLLFAATLFNCVWTWHSGTGPLFECVYNVEEGLLACNHNSTTYVNCSAVIEVGSVNNYDFGVFRLGWPDSHEDKRFWIYSFNAIDNSTFNQTLSIDDESSTLFVYSADKFVDYGIRVTDLVCFEQFFSYVHVEQVPVTTTRRNRRVFSDVFTNKYGSYWWGK